jgi:hypothetical protein
MWHHEKWGKKFVKQLNDCQLPEERFCSVYMDTYVITGFLKHNTVTILTQSLCMRNSCVCICTSCLPKVVICVLCVCLMNCFNVCLYACVYLTIKNMPRE